MPSALERRLDRLAETLGGGADEAQVYYCTDDDEAERLTGEADQAGRPKPLCIVTGYSGDGGTVADMVAAVAVEGRRIHDPPPEGWFMPAGYLWQEPRRIVR